ncbi:MAG: response regulator transcription factor [Ruminococcaceae bacterium]|nr:response regulator transcription factor [Oscillospiraceae bacterium]
MRILLAEDERPLSRAIIKLLEKNNFSADAVYNGKDAISYIELGNYDVLILDIMMPEMDGISVLKKIRKSGNNIPVLILSAKAQVEDKVLGLDSGANYYLTKPFETEELLATIRAITRTTGSVDTKITYGNITLNRATFELSSPEGIIRLANKEFQMMEMLMAIPRRIIPTERFMEKIWGFDNDVEINIVWVYISYLRKKLSSLGANIYIKASRNAGYSLEELQ